ncbi:hypothetical protein HDU98_008740 [Podochytrium sp. JEL0797]|nr:hypothetical protein HDU98_008740 [Podochytrium sp. JEL0797]
MPNTPPQDGTSSNPVFIAAAIANSQSKEAGVFTSTESIQLDPAEAHQDLIDDATGMDDEFDEIMNNSVLVAEEDEDEAAVEDADRLLCGEGAENATVKDLQDAINVSRPFGLKLWKPALYQKIRSINAVTEAAIHEDPNDPSQKPITRFFNPGNLFWFLLFGWWISLVYIAIAVLMLPFAVIGFFGLYFMAMTRPRTSTADLRRAVECTGFSIDEMSTFRVLAVSFFELERCWQYVLLALNFARYMLWPFGKCVIKKRRPSRCFISIPHPTANTDSLTHPLLGQDGNPSNPHAHSESDLESEYGMASVLWDVDETDSDDSDGELPSSPGLLPRRVHPRKHVSVWNKLLDAGPAGLLFRFLAFTILGPSHLLVCVVCYLGIFSLPVARLTFSVLTRLTRRRPLSVRACWGEDSKAFGLMNPTGNSDDHSRREFRTILCTNNAWGWKYYKFTFDGINIIILNLNAVVLFTLVDSFILGPLMNHRGIGSYNVIFVAALVSVIPLAYLIGMAVSSITAQTGSLALGAVVNATFGSIVEILLYCLALMQGKTRMVEGSIIGSFMAGLLALPGSAMFFGGLTQKEQKFNAKAAGVTSTLLIMAILGVFSPTFFQSVYGTFEMQCADCPNVGFGLGGSLDASRLPIHCRRCRYRQPHATDDPIYNNNTRTLVVFCSIVLVLIYAIGLLFTLRTHSKNIYPPEPKKAHVYRISTVTAVTSPKHGFISGTLAPSDRFPSATVNRNSSMASSFGLLPSPLMHPQSVPRLKSPRSSVKMTFPSPLVHQKSKLSQQDHMATTDDEGSVCPSGSENVGGASVAGKGKGRASVAVVPRQFSGLSAVGFDTTAIAAKKKEPEEEDGGGGHDNPNWSTRKSGMVLLLATLFFSLIAEVLIDCVDNVIDTSGGDGSDGKWVVDEKILGLTLIALVPTVTEFYNAIAFARQGNIALSLEIGSAYTIQVALLQIPALVAFSAFWSQYGTSFEAIAATETVPESKYPFWMFIKLYDAFASGPNAYASLNVPPNKDTFTLIFPRWDVIAVLFGVFTVTYLYIEGKSNYFKGSMLLFAYGVLMVAFILAPAEFSMDSYY